jgi:hypothetical protein
MKINYLHHKQKTYKFPSEGKSALPCLFSGNANNGSNAGFWYWNLNNGSGNQNRNIGSQLSYFLIQFLHIFLSLPLGKIHNYAPLHVSRYFLESLEVK